MASTRVQIRLCRAVDTPLVAWTGLPCGSAAAVWAGHEKVGGEALSPSTSMGCVAFPCSQSSSVWATPSCPSRSVVGPLVGCPASSKECRGISLCSSKLADPFSGGCCLPMPPHKLGLVGSTFAGAFRVVGSLPAIPARYRAHVGFYPQTWQHRQCLP